MSLSTMLLADAVNKGGPGSGPQGGKGGGSKDEKLQANRETLAAKATSDAKAASKATKENGRHPIVAMYAHERAAFANRRAGKGATGAARGMYAEKVKYHNAQANQHRTEARALKDV